MRDGVRWTENCSFTSETLKVGHQVVVCSVPLSSPRSGPGDRGPHLEELRTRCGDLEGFSLPN